MLRMIFLFLILFPATVIAEIPREIKEEIAKDLDRDEEFKKSFINYLESRDSLYAKDLYKDKTKFQDAYLNHIKDKNCMTFLSFTSDLKQIPQTLMKYATKVESLQKSYSHAEEVEKLIGEMYELNTKFTSSPSFDGYKFCRFKVSESRLEIAKSRVSDQSVLKADISPEEKSKLIVKDNKLLKQATEVLMNDAKKIFLNKKISKMEITALGKVLARDWSCALYFTSEDKQTSTMAMLGMQMEEIKKKPEYNKAIEEEISELLRKEISEIGNNDYKNCSFELDKAELSIHQKRIQEENAVANERYELLQKLITTSHPKIIQMVKEFEKSYLINGKLNQEGKKAFINNFPEYLTQVDQVLTGSFYNLLKDPLCKNDLAEKLKICMVDKRFSLLSEHPNLMISLCSQEHKESLKTHCQFN